MNTQDLLEQASLDALGLLDESERKAFETAYRAAPPAVQAQIRREQARFAATEALLPKVDAPAGLKFRVMAAVREAIQSFNRVETARRVEHTPFLRSLMWHSTPLWRAACIGFATATVVLGVFFSVMSNKVKDMAELNAQNMIIDDLRPAPGIGEFMLTRATPHDFVSKVAEAQGATACIHVNADGEAQLVCKGLPVANGQYKLVVLEDNGERRELASFTAFSVAVPMPVSDVLVADVARLAIIGPAVEGGADLIVMAIG